jgi:two-component system, NtrC family, response regulator HydG
MRGNAEVLIIDDDARVRHCLASALSPPYRVHQASTGEEGLDQYERFVPDVILLDVMLPQMSGLAVLRKLKRMASGLPVIMMTGYAEVQTAVEAIKLGAADYLQKPIDSEAVLREVGQLLARRTDQRATARQSIIGQSAAMKRVWRLVDSFAATDIPVLLQGETGTGKGVVAEALHRTSKRSEKPFVAIDCATIPEQLAESELFGYEDGAFTGAGKKKRGRVAFADRGTLFLDEVGTLSLATQAKLLTLLEQQHFMPLGSRSLDVTHLDVRFISATNVPLHRAAADGTFRVDLYHRINGVTIELPPLREREDDIELLARHFVAEVGRRLGKDDVGIHRRALDLILQYSWPGNIRELQRVISAAVVLADDEVAVADLPEHLRGDPAVHRRPPATAEMSPPGELPLPPGSEPLNLREIKEWAGREAQRRVILELQKRMHLNRQQLARILGVDPKTLRARLKELSADLPNEP